MIELIYPENEAKISILTDFQKEFYRREYAGLHKDDNAYDDYVSEAFERDDITKPVTVVFKWRRSNTFAPMRFKISTYPDLAELNAIVGGKEMDFKYKDCKKEMDMVNKAFIETMIDGDFNGRGFQYPIPTYSITRNFDWSDTENNRLLFEMTAKYGTPYFSNYINSDMEPSDVRSMCCRLRLDLRELRKKSGGFFGSGESTGSIGVVTINMPRIAYLSKTEEEFYAKIKEGLQEQFVADSDIKFVIDLREYALSQLKDVQFADATLKRWLKLNNEKMTDEEIANEYPKMIEDLKWQMVKDLLAKENNVKIEKEDIEAVAKRSAKAQFAQYGMLNVPEDILANYVEEMLKDKNGARNAAERAGAQNTRGALFRI